MIIDYTLAKECKNEDVWHTCEDWEERDDQKRSDFPKEYEEYSEDDYYDYRIQCAFNVAYKVLEGEKK